MSHSEDIYYQDSLDDTASPRFSNVRIFKVGATLMGGACLLLLTMVATQSDSAARLTGLVSMPTSLRHSSVARFGHRGALASLPGASPWKELAIAAMQATNGCDRDVAANARLRTAFANLDDEHKAQLAQIKVKVQKRARQVMARASSAAEDLAGQGLGSGAEDSEVWDPLTLSAAASEGQLLYLREAELKHGRICMLASLGAVVAEKFHPFFGGEVDAPAALAVRDPALALFWLPIFVATGALETFSFGRWDGSEGEGMTPALKEGLVPGDLGYDPLGIKPVDDPELLLKRQNQELLHGRLAMIASAGQIAEGLFTNEKLHGAWN
jgi:light-harvesting complex I chlorophyll a/b binding protein 1